ncbi:thermonuclease family protein [Rhodobacteraceae bacterium D3-12]|nr:thermonuclease family protein [Rhodobacteraceae bacterium D3-12]
MMRAGMKTIGRALLLTGASVAAWLFVVRMEEQPGPTAEVGCVVSYVYDGDTVALSCDGREERARLVGFDTPETRNARCEAEAVAGKDATERLRALIAKGGVAFTRHGTDKYGRSLIRLSVGGVDVAETMIREDYAVAYSAGTRIDWCHKLEAA